MSEQIEYLDMVGKQTLDALISCKPMPQLASLSIILASVQALMWEYESGRIEEVSKHLAGVYHHCDLQPEIKIYLLQRAVSKWPKEFQKPELRAIMLDVSRTIMG